MNVCIVLKYKSRAKRIFKLIEWLIKRDCKIELIVDTSLIKKLKIKPNLISIIKVNSYTDKEYDFSAYKKYISKKKIKGTVFINDTFSTYNQSYILLNKLIDKSKFIDELKFNFPVMSGLSVVSNYQNFFRNKDMIGTAIFYLNIKGINLFKKIFKNKKKYNIIDSINLLDNKYYLPHYATNNIKIKNKFYETMLNFQIQQTGTLVFIGRGLKEKILINLEKSINYGIFKFSEFVRKIFL